MSNYKKYKNLYWEADGLLNAIMEKSEMPVSEVMTLFCLAEGIDTQLAICKKLYMPKQTIHSAIKKLESQGFVVLAPQKGKDKTRRITLTDSGRDVYLQKVFPVEEAESKAFASLDEKEQEELVRITAKYNDFLRKATEEYIKDYGKN